MQKTLDELEVGESGRILTVLGDTRLRRRLFDMGVTPKALVYVKKMAPLGDPIEITVRGYDLSLRKSEANLIVLEVLE